MLRQVIMFGFHLLFFRIYTYNYSLTLRFLDLLTQRRRETADALNATATSNALPAPAPVPPPALPKQNKVVVPSVKAQVPKVEPTQLPNVPISKSFSFKLNIPNLILVLFKANTTVNKGPITSVDDFVADGDEIGQDMAFLNSTEETPSAPNNGVIEQESDR